MTVSEEGEMLRIVGESLQMMRKHGTQAWTGLYCARSKLGSGCGFSDMDFGAGESSHMESHAC